MSCGKSLSLCFVMFRAYPLFKPGVDETFGGSEVELYNLALYFSKIENVRVDFIVGDYGQSDIEFVSNIRLIKVKYMRLDKYKSIIHKLLRYFYLFKVLLTQNSQICITKTASELLGWMVIFLKIFKKKKVVFRLGSDKDTKPEYWKKSRKLYYLYKFGLKRCDLIYSQSEDQKISLLKSFGIESKVIKNAFILENKKSVSDKSYILWVSRCEPLKRPLLFVELARSVPSERFVIIMPHANKAEYKLDKQIEGLIHEVKKASRELENLEYLEFVPFNQIQDYFNNAKLFINTSEFEGFPNAFIQACLGSTGILSLNVNPDDFLTKNKLGLCTNENMDKTADFIKRLSAHEIERLGENAYEYVIKNHDVSVIGKNYIDDFRKLI